MLRLHLSGKTSASPGTHVEPRSRTKEILAGFGEERGQSLVEFALVVPILLLLFMGIITFAIAFWNQITLTNATNVAAQLAAVSRQQVAVDLCNPVNNALYQAGTGIRNPSVANPFTFSILVNGSAINKSGTQTPVSSNIVVNSSGVGACPVLLSQGQGVTVSTTYGCNLNFFGFKFGSNCQLSANTMEAVQ